MSHFQIKSLQVTEFSNLFSLDNEALEKTGARSVTVDKNPGFPCRVSLQHAEIGEKVILLPYQHHQTQSPYQATGPIFVREKAATAKLPVNEIPKILDLSLLSIRAYDKKGIMIEAFVSEGHALREILANTFNEPAIHYMHLHYAKRGCYICKVERP